MKRISGLLIAVAVVVLGWSGPASAHDPIAGHDIAYARAATAPVLLVHGYLTNACPGANVTTQWAAAESALPGFGYAGPIIPIAYYTCDTVGTAGADIRGYNAYAPASLQTPDNFGVNTPIEDIAFDLAWYIHNHYTLANRAVSLVGHSMGGLIIRYMLDRVQAGDPNFPSVLYVQDVISISSPFDGVAASSIAGVCGSPFSYQCQEMTTGSAFVTALQAAGTPQGTYGSDWTAIGGSPCDFVPASSALDNAYAHLVDYYTDYPSCYNHTSYLFDTSIATDEALAYLDPGDIYATYTAAGEHSLNQIYRALTSSAW